MCRWSIVALALLAAIPVSAGTAAAQGPTSAAAAARLRLTPSAAASAPTEAPAAQPEPRALPDSVTEEKKDHTLTGLLVGAGVGFVAGWAFYNTLCEAVDNRCSDSRVPLLVLGTGAGASLGGLIGSLAD